MIVLPTQYAVVGARTRGVDSTAPDDDQLQSGKMQSKSYFFMQEKNRCHFRPPKHCAILAQIAALSRPC